MRTDILTAAAARGEDGASLAAASANTTSRSRRSLPATAATRGTPFGARRRAAAIFRADLPQSVYGFGNTQGKGVNGRLFYRLRLAANAQATMRLYIAGGYPLPLKAEEALALLRGQAGDDARRKARAH